MDNEQVDKRYLDLAEKWMTGKITPEEEAEFAAWYNAGQDKPVTVSSEFARDERSQKERMLATVDWTGSEKRGLIVRLKSWPFRRVAASVALILSLCILLLILRKDPGTVQTADNDIAPGENKAVLTLSNGKKILLDDSADGEIAKQSGIKITKKTNGELVYTVVDPASRGITAGQTNVIETPKGGQYQINLPDNTKIWLNAGSSLRYPVAFTGKERKVVLTGEAYFEVAPDKTKPFIVESDQTEIKVLGTHFNVMAYDDEETMNTTLLEGSVLIRNRYGKQLLMPGLQARVNKKNNQINVSQANLSASIAWKNGYFYFHDEDIRSIMMKVGRWYDVEVVYQGDVQSPAFGGTFSRYKKLSQLLAYLHEAGDLNFKLEGRRVIVMN
ncbi:FecR family protein [Arcticibacter tournemirensis]